MLQTLNKINSISDLAKEVLQIEADSVLELKNRIDEDFEKAIDILYACKGRVIVTGMGKSGHIGRKIAGNTIFNRHSVLFSPPCGKHTRGFGHNHQR